MHSFGPHLNSIKTIDNVAVKLDRLLFMKIAQFLAIVLALPFVGIAADVTSTWNGTTGDWSDSSRWSSVDFPNNGNGGFTFDAVINTGTVTLDQNITIEVLTQAGGAINGDFDLDVNDASTWSGGDQGGSGTTTFNAPVTITELHSIQDTRTINNAVSATFHSMNNRFFNAAVGTTFNNLAGATFAIDGNSDYAGLGTFNNAGTFNKSAGAAGDGITQIVTFNNSNVVNINSGELRLSNSGNHSGDFNVAAGGTLSFSGTHEINDGTTIDGDGTTSFGGNVNFNTATFELDTLAAQTGGTITGDGTLNFNESFTWSGGNQAGNGVSNFNAPVTITELHNIQDTRTINNTVSATFHSTNNRFINAAAGTIFNNLAGATFAIDGNSDYAGSGTFNNAGTFNKSAGATGDDLTIITATFDNSGTINVIGGELRLNGPFTSYDAGTGTLTEGTYNVTDTLRFNNADINTNQASITLNGPTSQIIDHLLADALLDFATNDTGAFFGVIGGRDFTTTAATFTNRGQVQLGGGTFTAPAVANESGAEIFGFGTIVPRPTNAGTIRAADGTLTVPLGIQGGSGTVQIDAGATLDLSAAALGSSAGMLVHNGDELNLGANNFSVGVDYQNANFGVGNAFDARANVSGSGQINASPGVTQALSGDVTGGGTATATMAFGNVHVGDSPTLNYRIDNTGASGPSLRGAIQTSVGGANLTDGRLGGAGVTASNYGPIATGDDSGDLAVTFNASSAGALTGQQVRIVNNFDNVGEQTLQITGAAYRYANPTAHTPEPVHLGNRHVGDPNPSQAISITNNVPADGFSESLNASIGGASGGVTTNAGSFTGLAPGATNNSSLSVGFSTATAGNKSGTATITLNSNGTGSSGLGLTPLASQTVNVTGNVYRLATASAHTPEPVNFGIIHVGDVVAQALSITNTADNDGFSERLNASIGSATGNATANGGSFTGLNPGSTNSVSLSVGIDTATAGAKAGTAAIELTSTGAGTSGLADTSLPSQTVNVTAQVNHFAEVDVVKLSGDGSLSMTGANQFTLDLGAAFEGMAALSAELGVSNVAAAPADSLAGSFALAASDFNLGGFGAFADVAAGDTHDGLDIVLDTATPGTFSGEITLQPQSTNPRPFSMNLEPITILLTGRIRVAGDYNDDGVVNAADYVLWRDTLGSSTNLLGDGNGNEMIDSGDYGQWSANFGNVLPGSGSQAAVPEPQMLALSLILALTALLYRRFR